MKASKKEILLLVGLFGILVAVGCYFLVYQPQIEQAEAIEQENQELQTRINDLSSKMENKDSYEAETERMNQEMEAIFESFPVDVKEEDAVLLAINQELIAPMMISSLGITSCDPVVLQSDEEDVSHTYEIDEIEEYEAQEGIGDSLSASDATATETVSRPSVLMDRSVTMNYMTSYDGLKRSIKNITLQDNRMSINNVTVSFDESTGLLSGTTVVDMYCIPGQPDKEYVQPNFSSVLLGSDNLFGSIELYGGGLMPLVDEEADSEEGEEEETEED